MVWQRQVSTRSHSLSPSAARRAAGEGGVRGARGIIGSLCAATPHPALSRKRERGTRAAVDLREERR